MARAVSMAVALTMAITVVQANECSNGGVCPSDSEPKDAAAFQTKLQMHAPKDGSEDKQFSDGGGGGGECSSGVEPKNLLSLLQTRLRMNEADRKPECVGQCYTAGSTKWEMKCAMKSQACKGCPECQAAAFFQQPGAQLLYSPGQLLYNPDHGVVVGYAARSASTLMVEMFLLSIDKLGAAVADGEHRGVFDAHLYAWDMLDSRYHVPELVLCRGSKVAQATKVTASLKLVNDPYVRAIASFLHQMHNVISGYCVPEASKEIHPMCPQLNIAGAAEGARWVANVNEEQKQNLMAKVTFIQWLESVKKVGFEALDMHTQPQVFQLESDLGCTFDHICRLDDNLQVCFDGVNAKSGTNFSVAGHSQFMSEQRSHSTLGLTHWSLTKTKAPFDREEDVASLTYAQLQELDSEPVTKDWYRGDAGERAAELVRELYKVDFAMYGYKQ